MNKRKFSVERLKNTRLMYGVISIILAAVIAFVAIPLLSSRMSETVEVVTITQGLTKGDLILEDHLDVVEVGELNLPIDIARNPEDVVGQYAATDLVQGDYLLSANVSEYPITSDINLEYLPDGKMAMSFSVKTLAAGLSGKLQTGDIIRLFYFKEEPQSFEELSFLKVLSVTDSEGYNIDATKEISEDEEKQLSSTVTILVSPEQALIISGMESDGNIHVSLVVRNNSDLAEELLIRQDEIIAELYPEDDTETTEETSIGIENQEEIANETDADAIDVKSNDDVDTREESSSLENKEIGG